MTKRQWFNPEHKRINLTVEVMNSQLIINQFSMHNCVIQFDAIHGHFTGESHRHFAHDQPLSVKIKDTHYRFVYV